MEILLNILMGKVEMGNFFFNMDLQEKFAKASLDFNKIHVDNSFAEKSYYGEIIVHGMHVLLWVIEKLNITRKFSLKTLSVKYVYPIYLNKEVFYKIVSKKRNTFILEVFSVNSLCLIIDIKLSFQIVDPLMLRINDVVCENIVFKKNIDGDYTKVGEGKLYYNKKIVKELFPKISRYFNQIQLATLISIPRVFAMEFTSHPILCSELSINFSALNARANAFTYKVSSFDKRFSCAQVNLKSACFDGILKLFLLPLQIKKESYKNICKVDKLDFSKQHVLVIGGSRGLGALCVKILVASGANVKFTWHNSATCAKSIMQEIISKPVKFKFVLALRGKTPPQAVKASNVMDIDTQDMAKMAQEIFSK